MDFTTLIARLQRIKTAFLIITVIVLLIILLSKCDKTEPQLVAVPQVVVQEVSKTRLNDSIALASQQVIIAETQEQLHILQSALSLEIAHNVKMGKIIASVEHTDSIVYRDIPGKPIYRDTTYSGGLFPLRFKHSNKYMTEYYSVYSMDSATIDSLAIIGKEHLIIGETGKWYQKKGIKIGLVNENPYFVVDSLHSVVYKPKQELQIGFGPVIMMNKTSASLGAGLTLKKGIFSFTFAYKFF